MVVLQLIGQDIITLLRQKRLFHLGFLVSSACGGAGMDQLFRAFTKEAIVLQSYTDEYLHIPSKFFLTRFFLCWSYPSNSLRFSFPPLSASYPS